MKKELKILSVLLLVIATHSCKKYQDPAPIDDPRIDNNFYCNDPLAVNYNVGFPGKPDQSLCIFPTSGFEGSYTVEDSLYTSADSFLSASTYPNVLINSLGKSYVSIHNYCSTDSLILLCTRYLYISTDTLGNKIYDICGLDTMKLAGRKFGMDTSFFTMTRRSLDAAGDYHILSFHRQ